MVADAAIKLGRSQNYAPDQPIKFSHKVHAGDNKIDCKYCHTTVEYGKIGRNSGNGIVYELPRFWLREGNPLRKNSKLQKVVEANETKNSG